MSDTTLSTIKWAKKAATENEVVAVFWEKLCDAVNQKPSATPEEIYSEIRLYGSSTLLKLNRPDGVRYHEVAADVADKMAGWAFWQKSPYGYDSIEKCEKFVLEKMEIRSEDLEKLQNTVTGKARSKAVTNAATNGAVDYTSVSAVAVTAALVARQIALQLSRQLVAQIARSLNIFLAALVIIDIAGPAYRCTIPAIAYTSLLRKMYISAQKEI